MDFRDRNADGDVRVSMDDDRRWICGVGKGGYGRMSCVDIT
jgi:hypothetical protein